MADEPVRPVHLPPLSTVIPPLILGTATFNTQYVDDPKHMPYRDIVRRALVDLDVRGFDTSPYYGPAEDLLGEALEAATTAEPNNSNSNSQPSIPRSSYFIESKAGRLFMDGFDYSPAAICASVHKSLKRLRTPYLDLVYAHDVEFVSPDEVVGAVRALRSLRSPASSPSPPDTDQPAPHGLLRYVGISGYPVPVLVDLAERILRETGEPIDAVLSYGHCTVQNAQLVGGSVLTRLRAAGVSVVLNASLLNMGLLTTRGVDSGPLAAWHPSPPGLRASVADASLLCQGLDHYTYARNGTSGVVSGVANIRLLHPPQALERIALRYALDTWSRTAGAANLGTSAIPSTPDGPAAIGPSVLGASSVEELTETVLEWWNVLDSQGIPHTSLPVPNHAVNGTDDAAEITDIAPKHTNRDESLRRTKQVANFVQQRLWPVFGQWKDYAWVSPPKGWVNKLGKTKP